VVTFFFNAAIFAMRTGLVLLRGIIWAVQGAVVAFRWAMTLLSAAMDANPIAIVIIVIAALIGVIIWAIVKHKELGEAITKCWDKVPVGVRNAITSTASFAFAWTNHWNNIKNIVQTVINWFKTEWETVLNWLASKLETVFAFLKAPAANLLGQLWTDVTKPMHMPNMTLSPAHAEALAHPALTFSEMLNQNRAATQASEATTSAIQNMPHAPIQVNSTIKLDGKKVGQAVTTHQQAQVTGGK
jgi:hypothetical protein